MHKSCQGKLPSLCIAYQLPSHLGLQSALGQRRKKEEDVSEETLKTLGAHYRAFCELSVLYLRLQGTPCNCRARLGGLGMSRSSGFAGGIALWVYSELSPSINTDSCCNAYPSSNCGKTGQSWETQRGTYVYTEPHTQEMRLPSSFQHVRQSVCSFLLSQASFEAEKCLRTLFQGGVFRCNLKEPWRAAQALSSRWNLSRAPLELATPYYATATARYLSTLLILLLVIASQQLQCEKLQLEVGALMMWVTRQTLIKKPGPAFNLV